MVLVGAVVGGLLMTGMIKLPGTAMPTTNTTTPTNNTEDTEPTTGKVVEIKNLAFVPSTITVKVGETVSWTNKDLVGHTATADDKSWDTGNIGNGSTKSITFDKAGTFTYHCTPHPFMKGTVVVTN